MPTRHHPHPTEAQPPTGRLTPPPAGAHPSHRGLGAPPSTGRAGAFSARTRPLRSGSVRAAAALGLLAVVVGGPAVAAAPAAADAGSAAATTDPAKAAAGYLARQLVGSTHYVFDFDHTTPDQGLTADAVFSMAGAKTAGGSIDAATTWLAANSADYLVLPDFDGDGQPDGASPGGHAKLALVAETTDRDPHTFGGDLLGRLRELECRPGRADCAAAEDGKFKAPTPSGAYPNVFSQSLAIIALRRSPVEADRDVTTADRFLGTQQCADGGFPSQFPASGAPCVSDVDGTGIAVQALVSAGADAERALSWLESKRHADGSFAGLVPDATGNLVETVNSNSTALAVQALVAAGRDAAASTGWLRRQQVGCSGPVQQRGAVTFAGSYNAAALRATAQAALALAGGSLVDVTAEGAAPAAPTLACPAPTPGPTPSASPPAGAPTPVGHAAPTPELPATNGVNGSAVRLLAGVGAGLVGLGTAAILLVRRRA